MNNFLVFTFSSMGEQTAQKLIHSCNLFGFKYDFYGKTTPFRDFRQFKIDMIIDYLHGVNEKYVMYTDANDSWFLGKNIMENYKRMDAEVVVSANKDHYPQTDLYTEYPQAPTSFRYICSSQFMGERRAVIETLKIIQKEYFGYICQEGWNYCYSNGSIDIKIDHGCSLFLNMTNVTEDDIFWNRGKLVLRETLKFPASIHFGGPKGESPNGLLMEKMWNQWLHHRQ